MRLLAQLFIRLLVMTAVAAPGQKTKPHLLHSPVPIRSRKAEHTSDALRAWSYECGVDFER